MKTNRKDAIRAAVERDARAGEIVAALGLAANLGPSLDHVLVHEGGFVNHPKDPGGATNRGVTQAVYDGWRKAQGLAPRSVKLIVAGEVEAIYDAQYWDAVKADDLPGGIDYAVFDFAVNSGPSRAIRFLQSVLGVATDGVIGVVTLAAARAADAVTVINALCDNRLAFLKGLSTWPTFGDGWRNRVKEVRADALALAAAAPVPLPPDLPDVPDEPQPKEPSTMNTIITSLILSALRHGLTALAGVLVTYGVIEQGQSDNFIVILLGIASYAIGQSASLIKNAKN